MPSDINPSATNNLVSPQNFEETLFSLQQQLPPLLEDYNSAYILYQNNPGVSQYQEPYNTSLANLNQLNSNLFVLSNEVESNSDDLQDIINALNTKIGEAQKINTDLKNKIQLAESNNYATTEMIINYKQIYTGSYLKNWSLLLSIILAGVAIKIVFNNKIGIIPNKPN
jgi:hypothetical protein